MYADFNFYTTQYGGTLISEDEFNRYSRRAAVFMDYYTRNKLKAYYDQAEDKTAIQMCACELAECYSLIEQTKAQSISNGGELQSESVGSYSRTFRSGAEIEAYLNAKMAGVMQMYLLSTGLLYRGVNYVCPTHCDCI